MTAPVFDPLMAYPSYDAPFLTTWDGVFEAVFVAFHPFARVKGRDPFAEGLTMVPEANAASTLAQADDGVLSEVLGKAQLIYASSALTLGEVVDPADLEVVTWADIAREVGMTGPAKLNHALLTMVGALKQPDQSARDALVSHARRQALFLPTEGAMQPLLLPALRRWFEGLGQNEVIVQPEFDIDPNSVIPVEQIEGRSDRVSLYDHGRTSLAVVDWDSFFTLIAGPRQALQDWVRTENLDGFFADKTTGHDWWHAPVMAPENTRS